MGLPMAVNLQKAGVDVVGHEAFQGSRDKATARAFTVVRPDRCVGVRDP